MKLQTFYSYKGGVGRSLLLANYAHFLCRSGQKVVVVDLDLEAPGLHFKFELPERVRGGVVEYAESLLERTGPRAPLAKYLVPVTAVETESGEGRIELLPAGRAPSAEYNRSLFRILASQFASRGMTLARVLGRMIDDLRSERPDVDFILVDSRTGITETGRFAVGDVNPHTVICVLLRNDENRKGAGGVIRGLLGQGITVVPVLARLPMLPYEQEKYLLKDERARVVGSATEDSDSFLRPFQVLHADLRLPIEERLLWPSKSTLLESALLYDYVQLFQVLEPEIFQQSPYRHLLGVFPHRGQLDEWSLWTLLDGADGSRQPTIVDRLHRRAAGAPAAGVQPRFNYVPSFFIPTARSFQKLGRDLADRLARKMFGTDTKGSPVGTKNENEINFDLLAMQMREGIFDFCGEAYFLTGTRTQFAAVLQFGWLRTFECVVRKGTSVHETLVTLYNETDPDVILRALFTSADGRAVEVGLLGETAATSEMAPHVTTYVQGDRLTIEPNHQQLVKWLTDEKATNPRVVFCDHGVAARMREVIRKRPDLAGEYSDTKDCPILRFSHNAPSMPRGIPVGFLYPREDAAWRREISLAFAKAVDAIGPEGWATVRAELMSVRIEPFAYADLRSYLLMDMTIDEALSHEREHHLAT